MIVKLLPQNLNNINRLLKNGLKEQIKENIMRITNLKIRNIKKQIPFFALSLITVKQEHKLSNKYHICIFFSQLILLIVTIFTHTYNQNQKYQMFWQGGGKKRLKNQIEKIMEIPATNIETNTIGKNDDELLTIYYLRNDHHSQNEQSRLQKSNAREEKQQFGSNIKSGYENSSFSEHHTHPSERKR